MEKNIIHSLNYGERITSTYADIYFDDSYCHYHDDGHTQASKTHILKQKKFSSVIENEEKDAWKSPSDLIIDIIDLKPPFTSKITRGKTHEGILAIGDNIVDNERIRFLKRLTNLIHENDAAWEYILEHEKSSVLKKINNIYSKIFLSKSKTMTKEIDEFYEKSLQEIENHLRFEVQNLLISVNANIINDMNVKIREKIHKEKENVEKALNKLYKNEIFKIKQYYKLLLNNEQNRINKLINSETVERNDILKAFCKQVEAENITSTMYIMCTERKKCKIKRFNLDQIHSTEIKEKLQKIKEKQDVIDAIKAKETKISDINNEWEQKIKKVLRLFLKFISFALKLLPEQITFLLDLEKMVVLQLNEIKKTPSNVPCSILVNEEKLKNIFQFAEPLSKESSCNKQPFTVVGDLSEPIPAKYGSRETLPSDVELPTIRLQRHYVYAKCHKYEEIKALLESQTCKCNKILTEAPSYITPPSESIESIKLSTPSKSESYCEPLLIDDVKRIVECPARSCSNWSKRNTFPHLDSYLDFTEENFSSVKAILSKQTESITNELINAKNIAHKTLPFAPTNEKYHHVDTQYSSQENVYMPEVTCSCTDDSMSPQERDSMHSSTIRLSTSKYFDEILKKRKTSLRRMIQQNPKLLKMFTDESFDFVF